jgi:hypothetical protein
VLFVFAFSIVGEDTYDETTIVPRPLVWALILLASGILGWFTFPLAAGGGPIQQLPFARVLWEQRGLDVLAQIVLIFAGSMGLLGLLVEQASAAKSAGLEAGDDREVLEPVEVLEPAAGPQPEALILEEERI